MILGSRLVLTHRAHFPKIMGICARIWLDLVRDSLGGRTKL